MKFVGGAQVDGVGCSGWRRGRIAAEVQVVAGGEEYSEGLGEGETRCEHQRLRQNKQRRTATHELWESRGQQKGR